jgi:hypothetical protein
VAGVTQRVDPSDLDDLLGRPPRAAIAFADGARVETVPVAYRRHGGRHWIGVGPEDLPAAGAPERAVLLVDDGRYWFELRAVTLRGRLVAAPQPPPASASDLVWLELVPEHVVAWDYGTLHEEPDA